MTNTTTPATGTYRVYFRLGDTGRARFLHSSRVVSAASRSAAIASVPGGVGADIIEAGPED